MQLKTLYYVFIVEKSTGISFFLCVFISSSPWKKMFTSTLESNQLPNKRNVKK